MSRQCSENVPMDSESAGGKRALQDITTEALHISRQSSNAMVFDTNNIDIDDQLLQEFNFDQKMTTSSTESTQEFGPSKGLGMHQ